MGRLFWKILFSLWGALLLGSVCVGALFWALQPQPQRPLLAGGMGTEILLSTAAATLSGNGPSALQVLAHDIQQRMPHIRLQVVDAQGHSLLGHEVNPAAMREAREHIAHDQGPVVAVKASAPNGQIYLLYLEHHGSGPGFFPGLNGPPPPGPGRSDMPPRPPGEAGPSKAGQAQFIPFPNLPWLDLLVMGGLLVSLSFSALLAWYLSKPIRHLRNALQSLAQGHMETRVQGLIGKRRDELADLGVEFDRMSQQMQNLMQAQQRLLHDVSHELRSPMARLQAAIGLARQKPERFVQTLDRVELEVQRVDQLVGELLCLARRENAAAPCNDRVELNDLLASIIEDARFEASTQGKQIDFYSRPPGAASSVDLLIPGDSILLHRAIENVIRNAVHHSSPDSSIDITLHLDATDVHLSVADHGPGVPEDELNQIFEPFHRSEPVVRKTGGFGLGLAIARRAILAHNGSIHARNRDGGGLEVYIRLPRTSAPVKM